MGAVEKRIDVVSAPPADSRATLARATARREKLQALFDNASFIDLALRQGRYLRLCAAIAWASEREERARQAFETDGMVDRLRGLASGDMDAASR
ncbi:MAG TPA: hypothetical protein PKA55_07675 [Rhodoblastus sp.]|nr:hypothetical protein [Rhodoblastus sp.]